MHLNQWDLAIKTKLELQHVNDDDVAFSIAQILIAFSAKASANEIQNAYLCVDELRTRHYPTPATSIWTKVLKAKKNQDYEISTYADEMAFQGDDDDPECPEVKTCYLPLKLLNPSNQQTWREIYD